MSLLKIDRLQVVRLSLATTRFQPEFHPGIGTSFYFSSELLIGPVTALISRENVHGSHADIKDFVAKETCEAPNF